MEENSEKPIKRKFGGSQPGSGRPKGAQARLTEASERKVQWTGQTPAEFFQQLMQDDSQTMNLRIDAARCAAVYVHRKQPEALDLTANVLPVAIEVIFPKIKGEE
jgi:hypothetical protein